MSIQENTLKNDELDLSLATEINATNMSAIIPPARYCLFHVLPGRNYMIFVSNYDPEFDLKIEVTDFSGSGHQTKIIQSSGQTQIVMSGNSGKLLVLNNTYGIDGLTQDKPNAFVTIHSV
jgi:hypothetical protein